jgi:hypothetical protein
MSEDTVIGWRDGRYLYCNSHDSSQVIDPQPAKLSDSDVYEGVQCAWCKEKLV